MAIEEDIPEIALNFHFKDTVNDGPRQEDFPLHLLFPRNLSHEKVETDGEYVGDCVRVLLLIAYTQTK
jgi:hypothetical protein